MKKLSKMEKGEKIIGYLTARHLELRKKSIQLSDEQVRMVKRLEADCITQERKLTKEEMRAVHQLDYDRTLANMDMWLALNHDFEAWERPIGIRVAQDGRAALVQTIPQDPLKHLIQHIVGEHGHGG